MPIQRRPVVAGRTAKNRTWLEANDCFATSPVASGVKGVTRGNERINAIAGDAADAPYSAADDIRRPSHYTGRVAYRHSYEPAMKKAAIHHTPISNIKNVSHDAESRPLLLDRRSEGHSVVCNCRLHVHGPAGIDIACIHIKREDKVFLGLAAVRRSHCVQKERTGSKINNWRTDDSHGIELGAHEITCRHGRANVAFPDNAAIDSVEPVHIIRFGHGNDHCSAVWAAFNVKRLRVNVARNCAVKVEVPRQIGGSALRERGINVKTVSRIVIVELGNVDVPTCWQIRFGVCRQNCAQNSDVRADDQAANRNRRLQKEPPIFTGLPCDPHH